MRGGGGLFCLFWHDGTRPASEHSLFGFSEFGVVTGKFQEPWLVIDA